MFIHQNPLQFAAYEAQRRNATENREGDTYQRHLDDQANAAASFSAPLVVATNPNADIDTNNEGVDSRWICSISMSLMSDPVYFKGVGSDVCYERAIITAYLSSKADPKHPVLRDVSVDISMLTANTEMKAAIDAYVQSLQKKSVSSSPK